MQKGYKSIYLSLFNDDIKKEVAAVPDRRGRSEELHRKRNELLVSRHYYYTRIAELQYERTLKKLESEFFIAQFTIVKLIAANHDLLKKINADKPPLKYFRTKFPFLVWEAPR